MFSGMPCMNIVSRTAKKKERVNEKNKLCKNKEQKKKKKKKKQIEKGL
jgi:hypothetical protein